MEGWKVVSLAHREGKFYLTALLFPMDPATFMIERASCKGLRHLGPLDEVPSFDCYCGYYAYKDEETAVTLAAGYWSGLVCKVHARGLVIETEFGFRAEYVDVEEIIWPRCREHNKLKAIVLREYPASKCMLVCTDSSWAAQMKALTLGETRHALDGLARERGATLRI